MGHVLFQYALLAAGLIGALALFLSVKREIQRDAASNRKRLEEMAARVGEFQKIAPEPVYIPVPAARSGLNLSKRVQAMRMVRRNEDVSTVAAALGVTRKEVELLVRVQSLSRESVARARK
ncbi:MAG TPA: hypothetical protein VKX39_04130 [Bryobacteraceae bacterium]|jgi:hypothetical protein|nr:hypothetical protein [Bryobacteraceae bacterium]